MLSTEPDGTIENLQPVYRAFCVVLCEIRMSPFKVRFPVCDMLAGSICVMFRPVQAKASLLTSGSGFLVYVCSQKRRSHQKDAFNAAMAQRQFHCLQVQGVHSSKVHDPRPATAGKPGLPRRRLLPLYSRCSHSAFLSTDPRRCTTERQCYCYLASAAACLPDARRAFDGMPQRGVAGVAHAALSLFVRIITGSQEGEAPNGFSLVAVLKACMVLDFA